MWPSVHELAQAVVGALAPHADEPGQCADMVPIRLASYRWRRDTLLPCVVGERLRLTDICGHISDAGLRVASWNVRGLLDFTASAQDSRETKHHFLKRLGESNDIVCLQEKRGQLSFYMHCLPSTRNGIWLEPLWMDMGMQEDLRYAFGKRASPGRKRSST